MTLDSFVPYFRLTSTLRYICRINLPENPRLGYCVTFATPTDQRIFDSGLTETRLSEARCSRRGSLSMLPFPDRLSKYACPFRHYSLILEYQTYQCYKYQTFLVYI